MNEGFSFQRKIVFIPVKKPFKGFSNDFHIQTLKPTISSEHRVSAAVTLQSAKFCGKPSLTAETQKKLLNVSCVNENAILREEACSLLCENVDVSPGLVLKGTSNSLDQKQLKKSKKKFLKYHGSSMQLRPILLYMAYLSTRNKITKRGSLRLKIRCKEKLNKHATSSDVQQEDDKRDQMDNMLAGGLEETVVARWDDVELPSSQSLESKNEHNEIACIGYVGDEWDEEYDMGKRKKLRRLKQSFGGPNIFQQIATDKSNKKLKRAILDHSTSGNPH